MLPFNSAYRIYKTLIACIACIIAVNLLGATSFASCAIRNESVYYTKGKERKAAGWQTIDGNTYFFNEDGSIVTKSKTIDGVKYKFNSDGVCLGRYSGWTKDSKYRYYYKEGIRHTGWLDVNNSKYYFNRDGIMRTGWVAIYPARAYYFDKNGVWDGKDIYYDPAYKPETVGDFLLDFEFPVSAKYEARGAGNKNFMDFKGIQTVIKILNQNSDAKISFGERISDDEIERPKNIYYGNNDIMIRLQDKNSQFLTAVLSFSKDKAGNSYFYCNRYNFGVKLMDSTAYDEIAKLVKS